jgi:hypothetical protein
MMTPVPVLVSIELEDLAAPLLLLLINLPPSSSFIIQPENPIDPPHFVLSPLLKSLTRWQPKFPIAGQLVYTNEVHPTGNFTGKIVIYEQHNLQPKQAGCDALRHSGAASVILHFKSNAEYPGLGDSAVSAGVKADYPFPVFEITWKQNKSLEGWFSNQTRGVFVTMNDDPNPWRHARTVALPILSLVVLVMTSVLLVMATYKLTLLVLRDGLQWSVAQFVLVLNILSLLFRILWATTNPFGIYNSTSVIWVQVTQSLPFAFAVSGALLISLYWHEMIQRTNTKINMFLNRMRWPFAILCVLMFGFELATSISRGAGLFSPLLVLIDTIIYVVVVFSLLIFFLVTNIRIQQIFKKVNKTLSQGKRNKLKLANQWIWGISFVMLLWIISLLLIGTSSLIWRPRVFVIIFSIQMTSLTFMVLFQILLIRAPSRPWKWILCGLCTPQPDQLLETDSEIVSMGSTNRYTATSQSQMEQ